MVWQSRSKVSLPMCSIPPLLMLSCILQMHCSIFQNVSVVCSFEYFSTGMEIHGNAQKHKKINRLTYKGSIALVSTPVACFFCMIQSHPLLLQHLEIYALPSCWPLLYKNCFRYFSDISSLQKNLPTVWSVNS